MNLTAKTGVVVVGGIAFLILSLLLDMCLAKQGTVQNIRSICPASDCF